ncbi:SRPBCC family protein [Nonlabens mediterrranea]|uniref:SRPBCC family protein n=1 Tax=Nonlabens mediterrranea TaxID=1419947 RepID=A0ABS0A3L0_9FLAO|nr:SRPBCC family protein [Nonlabens mediterrranea]
MKVLKYLFLFLLVIIVGSAVYFSLQDGSYYISEKKTIKAPPEMVYEQISDFKNWNHWNPWTNSSDVTNTLGDVTTGINGFYTFTDEYGNGSMTFTALEPQKSIEADMEYHTGLTDSNSIVTMSLNPVPEGTEVTWTIKGEDGLKNKVMNFIFGLDLEEEIRPMYKKGLNNIEDYLLVEMKKYEISNPGLVDYGGGYILYKTTSTTMENFSVEMADMLQEIMTYMKNENISMHGMPMSIYEKFDYNNNSVIFSAAIPVRDRVIPATDATVLCTYIEPTRAVKVTLKGTYDHLQEAWEKGQLFMAQQGYITGLQAPFEIYKTDPALTPNPADNLTEIYLPVVEND